MLPSVIEIWLICRLFQPSTDTSQRECCQQISFLWRSILFPFAQLIDRGQVTPLPNLALEVWYAHLVLGLICFPFAAVYFLYDLSPITVTIREERRNFLHFITRLCAVLGGTFAMTGLPPALQDCFYHMLVLELPSVTIVLYGIPSCLQDDLHFKWTNNNQFFLIWFHVL